MILFLILLNLGMPSLGMAQSFLMNKEKTLSIEELLEQKQLIEGSIYDRLGEFLFPSGQRSADRIVILQDECSSIRRRGLLKGVTFEAISERESIASGHRMDIYDTLETSEHVEVDLNTEINILRGFLFSSVLGELSSNIRMRDIEELEAEASDLLLKIENPALIYELNRNLEDLERIKKKKLVAEFHVNGEEQRRR